MLPNFLGLGAPKAATTWLFRCLQQHPDVFVADSKEVSILDYGTIEGHLPTYEQHFRRAGGAHAIGEFSTRYLASTRAPARAARLIPNTRLVVSLRQPADQIYSHYWHLRRQNFHRRDTRFRPMFFHEALDQLDKLLLEPAYYHRNISRWLQHFDYSRLHVILYDDILAQPARVVRDLYGFLGVDRNYVPELLHDSEKRVREGAVAKNALMESIHRRLYTALARCIYTPMKSAIGVRRADRIKTALRAREVMGRLFYTAGYPEMPRDARNEITRLFEADIEALSGLIGRPLDHWMSEH